MTPVDGAETRMRTHRQGAAAMSTRIAVGLAVVCGALFAASCGRASLNLNGPAACTVTFSGALTGTAPCTAAAAYATSKNRTGVVIDTQGAAGTLQSFDFALDATGDLAEQTYTSGNSLGDTGSTLTTTTNQSWVQGASGGSPDFTLVVSNVTVVGSNASGRAYAVHGTYDATLAAVAGSGATGTVTAHAVF